MTFEVVLYPGIKCMCLSKLLNFANASIVADRLNSHRDYTSPM